MALCSWYTINAPLTSHVWSCQTFKWHKHIRMKSKCQSTFGFHFWKIKKLFWNTADKTFACFFRASDLIPRPALNLDRVSFGQRSVSCVLCVGFPPPPQHRISFHVLRETMLSWETLEKATTLGCIIYKRFWSVVIHFLVWILWGECFGCGRRCWCSRTTFKSVFLSFCAIVRMSNVIKYAKKWSSWLKSRVKSSS